MCLGPGSSGAAAGVHLLLEPPGGAAIVGDLPPPEEAVGGDVVEAPADRAAVGLLALLRDPVSVGPADQGAVRGRGRREPVDPPGVDARVVGANGGTETTRRRPPQILDSAAAEDPAEVALAAVVDPLAALLVVEVVVDVPGADKPAVQVRLGAEIRVRTVGGQERKDRVTHTASLPPSRSSVLNDIA